MKNPTRPQSVRIRRILELIREGAREGALPNAGAFCRELGVSRPTVMRDIEYLRDEQKAPVEYDRPLHGYRMTDATWRLAPLELSRREVFSFCIARKLLDAFRGTPLEVDMRSVFAKIAESLEGSVTLDTAALTERFTVLGEDYVRQDPRIWTALARHIDRKEKVRMEYEKFNGAVADYALAPYHLLSYHGDWYVLGAAEGRQGVSTFAVLRIRRVSGTGGIFAIPRTFDVRRQIGQAFGVTGGEEVMQVRLLFSPAVAGYIRHRVWHPTQRLRQRRDGSIELALRTAGWKELVRWVLSWQPDAKVLAPDSLRKRVESKMREALKK